VDKSVTRTITGWKVCPARTIWLVPAIGCSCNPEAALPFRKRSGMDCLPARHHKPRTMLEASSRREQYRDARSRRCGLQCCGSQHLGDDWTFPQSDYYQNWTVIMATGGEGRPRPPGTAGLRCFSRTNARPDGGVRAYVISQDVNQSRSSSSLRATAHTWQIHGDWSILSESTRG